MLSKFDVLLTWQTLNVNLVSLPLTVRPYDQQKLLLVLYISFGLKIQVFYHHFLI